MTNIHISNGTLVLTKNNQIKFSNFKSIVFKELNLKIESSLDSAILSQRNQMTFTNTNRIQFDHVNVINGRMNSLPSETINYSFMTFINIT